MTEQLRFTLKDAEGIRKSILEYDEYFGPLFDSIEIIGGIKERGYSNHDIDLLLTWGSPLENDKRTLEGLLSWLRKYHGKMVDYLHLFSCKT